MNETMSFNVVSIENTIPQKSSMPRRAAINIYLIFCNRKRQYFSILCKKSREINPSTVFKK